MSLVAGDEQEIVTATVTESLLADTTAVGERKVKEIKQNMTYKIQTTKQDKERGKKTLPLLAWLLSFEEESSTGRLSQ